MITKSTTETADQDTEARLALWKTICVAADEVRHRLGVRSILELGAREIQSTSALPAVATWQLIEALSLLCVIIRSEEANASAINLFGKTGPIEIREDGVLGHLWAQQTLTGDHSDLNGRPDLIVTTTSESPHPGNAARIIEAKCVRQLGTQTIRGEFGKAYDLRVTTYFIWSFYSPTSRAIAGAKGLGIDLQALGFDTHHRRALVTSPEALISHVANSQDQARRARRFAQALNEAERDIQRKLLGPAQ